MTKLKYLVRQPKSVGITNPPLLVLIHGYGSNENDLFSFADYLHPDFLVISLRAPLNLPMMGHAWYSIHFDAEQGKWSDDKEALGSCELVLQFLDELMESHLYDKSQVHLLGFSQGAILSYALGLTNPKRFASVIALSGYLNENITQLPKPEDAPALYAAHGSLDEVVPFDWGQRSAELLKQKGFAIQFDAFPVGHTISQDGFHKLLTWQNALLNKQ
ncbi:MAG: alpha/beta hydrolase-fold protein [Flavobacteriaceae bacterium]|nr:alpha/beta hydrolase-fold protein [Flavobacteriaceae bacterium]